MNTNKILLGALAGGVTYFILGFLVYGLALQGFMDANTSAGAKALMKEPMVWWAMIVGNLVWGLLLAVIFGRWAGIKTFATGAKAGAVIGLLVALGLDLMMYSMTDMYNMTSTLVDPLINAVLMGVTGGVVGWVLGTGNKSA